MLDYPLTYIAHAKSVGIILHPSYIRPPKPLAF
jgi:hypothetical protein